MTKHINELVASRRALLGGLAGLPLLNLAACATTPTTGAAAAGGFASVPPTNADTLTLPRGYSWKTLIAWGDALFDGIPDAPDLDSMTRADQEQRFGQNNDMLALFANAYAFPPPRGQDRLILCVNNEYASLELAYPALRSPHDVTASQIEALYASTGVSIVDIARDGAGWRVVKSNVSAGRNRRITPFSPVLFSGPAARHPWIVEAGAVVNASEPAAPNAPADAIRCGTSANCAGGLTPWGTYLTAEENFDGLFVGSLDASAQLHDPALASDAASFGYPGAGFADRTPRQFNFAENPLGRLRHGRGPERRDRNCPHTRQRRPCVHCNDLCRRADNLRRSLCLPR